ncbi:MAG: EFR1 family ferrodoxin [Bacteroidales bacterium]|nr:EFR1 family ferrodoxin [Bacteroidales bacterium]
MNDQRISRRSALKVLGASFVGLAAAASGLGLASSCSPKKSKRLVFFFTGTGNSLYVARQLAQEGTEPLSIAQEVHNENPVYEADEIGFVFPVYFFKAPAIVHEFFERSTFQADYFFAVATYGAMQGTVVEFWDGYTKAQGRPFDYITTLLMADNYLPYFDMAEQQAMEKNIPENLERIVKEVNRRTKQIGPLSDGRGPGQDGTKNETYRAEEIFTVTDACVACGICTSVCPHKSWSIGARSAPNGPCERCMACAQNCPQRAITLQAGERNPNARFRNEHVTLADIIKANAQRQARR